jgi:hypothetical protein
MPRACARHARRCRRSRQLARDTCGKNATQATTSSRQQPDVEARRIAVRRPPVAVDRPRLRACDATARTGGAPAGAPRHTAADERARQQASAQAAQRNAAVSSPDGTVAVLRRSLRAVRSRFVVGVAPCFGSQRATVPRARSLRHHPSVRASATRARLARWCTRAPYADRALTVALGRDRIPRAATSARRRGEPAHTSSAPQRRRRISARRRSRGTACAERRRSTAAHVDWAAWRADGSWTCSVRPSNGWHDLVRLEGDHAERPPVACLVDDAGQHFGGGATLSCSRRRA